MAHIEIDGIESVPHMQLRIIVQAAAAKPFVTFADSPADHVPNDVVVEMQVECNGVVEAHVLRVQRVSLHHAKAEGHQSVSATPREEPDVIAHSWAELAEKILGELLELHPRAVEHLQIERINLIDETCRIVGDAQANVRYAGCRLELLAQFRSR